MVAFSALMANDGRAVQNLKVPIAMRRGAAVEGVVLDSSANPVADASVTLRAGSPSAALSELAHASLGVQQAMQKTVRTSAEGKFRFSGLGEVPATIVVRSRNREFGQQKVDLVVDAEVKHITVVVARK